MRTRFAPSPTGFLHVGGLRTALYAYLVAKQSKGKFLVRIEDTDQERSVPRAIENILTTLHWAGLEPDEGVLLDNGVAAQQGAHGPYIQSERLELYKKYADQLIASGHAYYAFDTKDDIERMRQELQQAGVPAPKYDSSVRMKMKNSHTLPKEEVEAKLKSGEPYVIRLKVEQHAPVTWDDAIRGKTTFSASEVDDQVLLKSDGFPTYHLAHVVDDHLMEIDVVIRGEEWLSSTPKHLLLFKALDWPIPQYAHVPLLLNKDKSKLSKRQGDVAVEDYIAKGYLPEVLLNFLALLGWNPGTTQEIFSLPELVDAFSLDRVQKAGAIFDTEKLDWLQGQWMRKFSVEEFSARIQPLVSKEFPDATKDKDFATKAALIQQRIQYFHEAPEMMSYFYSTPTATMELIANPKQKVTVEQVPEIVEALIDSLSAIDEKKWNVETMKEVLTKVCEEKGFKQGQILWPLRAILTGLPFSPGAYEVAEVLGKDVTMDRLATAQKL